GSIRLPRSPLRVPERPMQRLRRRGNICKLTQRVGESIRPKRPNRAGADRAGRSLVGPKTGSGSGWGSGRFRGNLQLHSRLNLDLTDWATTGTVLRSSVSPDSLSPLPPVLSNIGKTSGGKNRVS